MKPLVTAGFYPLLQHYGARGQSLSEQIEEALAGIAAAGLDGIEPERGDTPNSVASADALARHGLIQPSCYIGGVLHGEDAVDAAEAIARRAREVRELGCTIIVVNPNPIDWNQPLDKDDAALRRQARALEVLGARLHAQGQTLAYHTHDAEMRAGAREFHHMLTGTDPELVRWCLDTHWVYRGAGNSQVAVEDAIRLYGSRCGAVHVRQSEGGTWSETFGPGDLDHVTLFGMLRDLGFGGPFILEQAVETGTPATRPFFESLRISAIALREQLAAAGY